MDGSQAIGLAKKRTALTVIVMALVFGCLPPAVGATAGDAIILEVDVSDAPRRLLHASERIPVKPGPLKLWYPKWIPGEHGPTGPVTDVAGLAITAGGRTVPWRRDAADMWALLCEVPAGVTELTVSFDFLSPPPSVTGGFSSGGSATAKLAVINWNQLVFYPDGASQRQVKVQPSITLPAGWKLGCALGVASTAGQRTNFAPTTLETLIDSPVIAGEFLRTERLGTRSDPPHFIHIAADSAAALQYPAEWKQQADRLVDEAAALFGASHYNSYHFLLTLSDHVAHFGLEHHESSDNRVKERSLVDRDLRLISSALLPHEFVHSWNGKYRRPVDLATASPQDVQRSNMLWVYEGLTQYLGFVLAARSGLAPLDWQRDVLARVADWAANQRGRDWRSLQDTATAAQQLYQARGDWTAWRRSVDFYDEGLLLWLEVDTVIRDTTRGQKSIDDFCRAFHGGVSGPPTVVPYNFDDLVTALQSVAPYDWKGFFDERVHSVAPRAPLGGIERGGWRLVYRDQRSETQKTVEEDSDVYDHRCSIGLVVDKDGLVADVIPGSPAFLAGIGPAMKIVAVNGRRYSESVLRGGIAGTKNTPMELLLENAEFFSMTRIDYAGGERYPHLEQDKSKDDVLGRILAPKSRKP